MTRRRSPRRFVLPLLVLLALPGLVLLVRDVFRPSRAAVVDRVQRWHPFVKAAAERFEVEPALIIAVIAVESKGEPDARSHKGAAGLMQLMPATAKERAAMIGLDPFSEDDLLDPAVNILLGTAYLKAQIGDFGGDEALALAAYNAGPTRVRTWIRSLPGASTREILDQRAFSATRAYVDNVLGYRDLIAGRTERKNTR